MAGTFEDVRWIFGRSCTPIGGFGRLAADVDTGHWPALAALVPETASLFWPSPFKYFQCWANLWLAG